MSSRSFQRPDGTWAYQVMPLGVTPGACESCGKETPIGWKRCTDCTWAAEDAEIARATAENPARTCMACGDPVSAGRRLCEPCWSETSPQATHEAAMRAAAQLAKAGPIVRAPRPGLMCSECGQGPRGCHLLQCGGYMRGRRANTFPAAGRASMTPEGTPPVVGDTSTPETFSAAHNAAQNDTTEESLGEQVVSLGSGSSSEPAATLSPAHSA